MLPKCPICLEKVFIPVELTSFNCSKINEINCHSFNRICEECVIDYLELNINSDKRSITKKCMYCETLINPQELIDIPYKIDFLLMSLDTEIINCNYCKEFKGNHLEIFKHVKQTCNKFKIKCECGMNEDREYILSNFHKENCCFYKKCQDCNEYIIIQEFDNHIKNIHDKNCCNICNKLTLLELNEHLYSECIYRLIQCRYCDQKLIGSTFIEHLIKHLNESKERLNLLREIYEKESKLHSNIIIQIKDIYQNIYNTNLDDDN
jgi:hypothetical protein